MSALSSTSNCDLEFKFIINLYGHETLPSLNTQNSLYRLHDLALLLGHRIKFDKYFQAK